MLAKKREQTKVYHGDTPPDSEARLYNQDTFAFEDYSILKDFSGSHPAVMRVATGGGGTNGGTPKSLAQLAVLSGSRSAWLSRIREAASNAADDFLRHRRVQ